jgi:hypothetical protein
MINELQVFNKIIRWGKRKSENKALSARGTAGSKSSECLQDVILPTCLSLTESVTALAREVSLGMSSPL